MQKSAINSLCGWRDGIVSVGREVEAGGEQGGSIIVTLGASEVVTATHHDLCAY